MASGPYEHNKWLTNMLNLTCGWEIFTDRVMCCRSSILMSKRITHALVHFHQSWSNAAIRVDFWNMCQSHCMKLPPQSSKAISILCNICAIQAIYAICTKDSSLVTRSITKRLLFVSLFSYILKACRAKCISITREPGKISRTNPYIKGTVPVKKEDNIVSVQLVYVLLCACLLI